MWPVSYPYHSFLSVLLQSISPRAAVPPPSSSSASTLLQLLQASPSTHLHLGSFLIVCRCLGTYFFGRCGALMLFCMLAIINTAALFWLATVLGWLSRQAHHLKLRNTIAHTSMTLVRVAVAENIGEAPTKPTLSLSDSRQSCSNIIRT